MVLGVMVKGQIKVRFGSRCPMGANDLHLHVVTSR